jgi:hypothetical protein
VDDVRIDWRVPAGRPSMLFGPGATRTEIAVVWLTVSVALAAQLLLLHLTHVTWEWWQWLVAVVVIVDVCGGVVANSLGTAKRFYSPAGPSRTNDMRPLLARSHLLFAAAHVHPFVVAVLWDGHWWWATLFYATSVCGVALVRHLPLYLERPAAMAVAVVSVFAAAGPPAPAGLGWLGPALVLKLVVAHSVTEAPFRPVGRA